MKTQPKKLCLLSTLCLLFIFSCKNEHPEKKQKLLKADRDTAFNSGSKIQSITLAPGRLQQLTNLGQIWGFLKYYHPAIAKGDYNWDAALFRVLPKVCAAKSNDEANQAMEHWIDTLGQVPACGNCHVLDSNSVVLKPDYDSLFTPGNLPESITKKLAQIRDNYQKPPAHYYISLTPNVCSPIFQNEVSYNDPYPDAGVRLLALYRYWNAIQYFYPSRHLITENWNTILPEMIPKFIDAKNASEYTFACLELISHIHDSHATSGGSNAFDAIKGYHTIPVQTTFTENKLVVTGYYISDKQLRQALKVGDIIEAINGVKVNELIKKYAPYSAASNEDGQIRELTSPFSFLFQNNLPVSNLLVDREGEGTKTITVHTTLIDPDFYIKAFYSKKRKKGYKIINNDIGYLYPASLKNNDIDTVKKLFKDTKGIVVDLRCYPTTCMEFAYAKWLKSEPSAFACFTNGSLDFPGAITWQNESYKNGSYNGEKYNGKLVILVNGTTISHAEFTTMALQTVTGAKVIGSTTAGADGNVSEIDLPGNIKTWISGIGIYYPDSTQTQRTGVKIDIPLKPTIEGIRADKDELLAKAIEVINEK